MYNTDDTDWAASQKGNFWRRINGIVLVVGRRKKTDGYWALVGEDFLPRSFETKSAAQLAAEQSARNRPRKSIFADEVDDL